MPRHESSHRMWDTPLGVIGNVEVGLAVRAVTILNVVEGAWFYAGLGILVVAGFGIAPGPAAHRAGVFWSGRSRSVVPVGP